MEGGSWLRFPKQIVFLAHFWSPTSMYHLWCEKKGAKKVLKFSHNFHTFLGTKLKKVWKNCEKSHQKPHPPFWEMVLLPKSCEKSVKKSHQKSHQKPHQNHTFQKRTLWYTQVRGLQKSEQIQLFYTQLTTHKGQILCPKKFPILHLTPKMNLA